MTFVDTEDGARGGARGRGADTVSFMGFRSTVRPLLRLPICALLVGASACSMPACGGTEVRPESEVGARPSESESARESESESAPEWESESAPESTTGAPSFRTLPDAPGPAGRAIAELAPARCRAVLRELAIPFERSTDERARAVIATPVVPTGPVGGIDVQFEGRRALHRVMDCRLLVAIHAWSPILRAAGVTKIRHLSAFRPGARVRSTGEASGHSRGLAFDPRFFERDGAKTLDVLEDWQPRERGASPCGEVPAEGEEWPPLPPPAEGQEAGALLRGLVCEAIRRDLFQVVVTPHHNDAHANHVHVEVVPGVDWSWSG